MSDAAMGMNSDHSYILQTSSSHLIAKKLVKWLFRDNENLGLDFGEWVLFLWANLIYPYPELSHEFFKALCKKIIEAENNISLSEEQKDLILYSALSYIPYTNPNQRKIISFKGVDYHIEKIPLTSSFISSPYYAYGLKPITQTSNQKSLLLFPGTTVPADNGFLAGLMTGMRPHGAVGTQLYARGQKKIESWIKKEFYRTNEPILCIGQSLGGAMSMHAHIHLPQQVDFYIFNPPSLTTLEKRIYDAHKEEGEKQERILKIVSHRYDPVIKQGDTYFPDTTFMYRHGRQENTFHAHAKAPDSSTLPIFQPYSHKEHHLTPPADGLHRYIIKPIFLTIVLLLHLVAFPFRNAINLVNLIINPVESQTENVERVHFATP